MKYLVMAIFFSTSFLFAAESSACPMPNFDINKHTEIMKDAIRVC